MSLFAVTRRLAPIALLTLATACSSVSAAPATSQVEVRNNHPYAVHMPWTLRDGSGRATGTVLLDVPANGRQVVDPSAAVEGASRLVVEPKGDGVAVSYEGKELGRLSWALVLHKVEHAYITADKDAHSSGRPADFKPRALSLKFEKGASEPLFTTWSAVTEAEGLKIRVDLDAYPAGYLDVRTTVTNESAPKEDVYAAVLTNWAQPGVTKRSVDYNSAVSELSGSTPWRQPGDRSQFVARGVNWIESTSAGGNVLWLNQFAPSFTVHRAATAKKPAEWVGANSPQLDQEAYVEGGVLHHVTELAHGSVRSYRSRLEDYVLPDASQPMTFTHRLILSEKPVGSYEATHAFVAYTTYNRQHDGALDLGARYVTFGTAYLPYSTLGENFLRYKLPGMSQDSYWPLAADVVKHYKLFADDIKRDLRLAKAMGLKSIRLHHLEMLWTTDQDPAAARVTPAERNEFLDFFFGEMKHLGMTALLDVKLPPEEIAGLVKRYRPQVDGVEIDNEVLIFGIKDEDVPYWKAAYAAVKRVAPDMPVHWTAHTNSAAFKRLEILGVPYDRLGQHAYTDGLDAIAMSRDFALQVASYATTVQKPPVITEWNWRFLTRMTEEARAKVYEPIFGKVLEAGAMPEMYQFQFNDCLAMSPASLKGIRHYELLNLSRRPKAEAGVFEKLVERYSDPASPQRVLKTEYQHVTVDGPIRDKAEILVSVKNTSDRTLDVTATAEGPEAIHPQLEGSDGTFRLPPGETKTVQLQVTFAKDALPGFYYGFVRFETKDGGLISYAPVELRRPGRPRMDASAHPGVASSADAFGLDLSKPTAVVYGDDCPVMELEAAWVVYQTVEAATGVPAQIYTASEMPKDDPGLTNYIFVGTAKTLPKMPVTLPKGMGITRVPGAQAVVISGATSKEATEAAMDYTLRYWRTAKDAACRRVPLVDRKIAAGGDAGQLP